MWIYRGRRIFVILRLENRAVTRLYMSDLYNDLALYHTHHHSPSCSPSSCCGLLQNVNELGQSGGMFHSIKSTNHKNVSLFLGGILSEAPPHPPTYMGCTRVSRVQSGGMFHPINSTQPYTVSLFPGGILSEAPPHPPTHMGCIQVSRVQSGMLCLTPSRRHLAAPPTTRGHVRSTRDHMTAYRPGPSLIYKVGPFTSPILGDVWTHCT